jgi:signal transduction histidine kinase
MSDVTERTRVDSVRRDFVANASHELKTPSAGIHLLAESAASAASDGDVDQAITFAKQIASESARLGRLVQDLLDLSRFEATAAAGTVTDVRAAIENALVGHGVAAETNGLSLEKDLTQVDGVDVLALVDPTDLAVALDNLLDNAIKYTEEGSVTVGVSIDGARLLISVRDTGIGIPGEDLPRVFERFYRVDRARSRESGGTGLGLALVRHVVERAGGSIEVISQPGRGSTFTMSLPRA